MERKSRYSRMDKYEKRRKNNRILYAFLLVAVVLTVFLFILIVSGSKDEKVADPNAEEQQEEPVDKENNQDDTNDGIEDQDDADQLEEEKENENDSEVNVEYIESDDKNVEKAYKADWEPIGTSQVGPHTTNYSDGSQDRIEIKQAVTAATELDPEDMVEWRVENGGEQKVIATVSDSVETEIFRVYLSWIDENGWKVDRIEVLKENDKKN